MQHSTGSQITGQYSQELHGALCPGGMLVIQMGGKGNADQVFSVLDTLVEKQRWRRYFEEFSFKYGFFGTEEYQTVA